MERSEILTHLTAMERRLTAAIKGRKPDTKRETVCPFIRQKEAIKLLGGRATLKRCERAGWLTAIVRRKKLVQYKREEVLACVYRVSQGEYPRSDRRA